MKKIVLIFVSLFTCLNCIKAQTDFTEAQLRYNRLLELNPYIQSTNSAVSWQKRYKSTNSIALKLIKENFKEGRNNFLLLIQKNLYNKISFEIQRYISDVCTNVGLGYSLVCFEGGTPQQIKEYIRTKKHRIKAVIFTGDIPPAFFKKYISKEKVECTPTDLYYMDFDGSWETDITGNMFTRYRVKKGELPSMIVARIAPGYDGTQTETDLIKSYFDKNHEYWEQGEPSNNKRALSYTALDWEKFEEQTTAPLKVYNYNVIASPVGKNILESHNKKNFLTNYLFDLCSNTYSFAYIACHSTPNQHEGDKELLSASDILEKPIKVLGLNLYACSAGNWTYSRGLQNNLAGAYLFGKKSKVLVCIASTQAGSMYSNTFFFRDLAEGKRIGDSFLLWWKRNISPYSEAFNQYWHYGLSIFGDPFIRFTRPVDLFISKKNQDYGCEPFSEEDYKNSPDIWIRYPGDISNKRVLYKPNSPVEIVVRVLNRGNVPSKGNEKLRIYWALNYTNMNRDDFKGKNYLDGIKTGGFVAEKEIPSVMPGRAVFLKIPWLLQDPKQFKIEKISYDLLAEIDGGEDPLKGDALAELDLYIKQHNNVGFHEKVFTHYEGPIYEIDPGFPGLIKNTKSPYYELDVFPTIVKDNLSIKFPKNLAIGEYLLCVVNIENGKQDIIKFTLDYTYQKNFDVSNYAKGKYKLVLLNNQGISYGQGFFII